MASFTKKTETNKEFAKGGSGHMVDQQHVGEQAPGGTATKSGSDGKFANGGKGKMFGFKGSDTAKSGQTGT